MCFIFYLYLNGGAMPPRIGSAATLSGQDHKTDELGIAPFTIAQMTGNRVPQQATEIQP